MELKLGVPEGTVKRKLFFNLNVHDFPQLISKTAQILQYADDCLTLCCGEKSQNALEVLQDNI